MPCVAAWSLTAAVAVAALTLPSSHQHQLPQPFLSSNRHMHICNNGKNGLLSQP